jgi:hypothetical protein
VGANRPNFANPLCARFPYVRPMRSETCRLVGPSGQRARCDEGNAHKDPRSRCTRSFAQDGEGRAREKQRRDVSYAAADFGVASEKWWPADRTARPCSSAHNRLVLTELFAMNVGSSRVVYTILPNRANSSHKQRCLKSSRSEIQPVGRRATIHKPTTPRQRYLFGAARTIRWAMVAIRYFRKLVSRELRSRGK